MNIINGVAVCTPENTPQPDPGAWAQIERARALCEGAALMADHHKGYGVPIGGVVASQELVSPTAVGFDIGCGNKAVLTDLVWTDVENRVPKIMDDIARRISFGIGRAANWNLEHPMFDRPIWRELPVYRENRGLQQQSEAQLGTVGSGNHYVDLFRDEEDRIWIGVHFGSRGLGHKTATWFLDAMGASDDMDAPPSFLHDRSDLGAQYIAAMSLAGEYAYAGRDAVCDVVREILGAKELDSVHNHHNYTWRETIGGREYWVGRKGATPAYPGQRGFVGATMGEESVILEGTDSPEGKALFHSTVHGAGRVMSRTAATGKINRRTGQPILNENGEPKRPGLVSREDMERWVAREKVELRGAGVDEAPQCYKRLNEVLAGQGDTVRVLHRLKPIGVAMAGANEFDPYKD